MNNPQDLVAKTGFFTGLHSGMGIAAKAMVVVFVVFTALNVEFANEIYSAIRGWIEATLNWYYISAVTIMLFVCFYLMFSRFGSIRLGDDDSRPEFSNFSWFAMLGRSSKVTLARMSFSLKLPVSILATAKVSPVSSLVRMALMMSCAFFSSFV